MEDTTKNNNPHFSRTDTTKIAVAEDAWKKILSPEVFYIARQKGTERPWTSKFEDFKELGTYSCAVCGNALFKSNTKFDSGCGWPSFFEPLTKTSIIYLQDNTLGMKRTEVQCGRCESHLGHVFEDGPHQQDSAIVLMVSYWILCLNQPTKNKSIFRYPKNCVGPLLPR